MPTDADVSVIKPSASFNKQVYKSIAAIALFVFTYLFLLCCALAIAVAFGWLGINILSSVSGFFGLVIGLGFNITGLLLVFFTIKFLFKRSHEDQSGKIEISADEQPLLFEFINKLTDEVGSPKPKRIFIIADVNAGVSYNSSFWSMFLPVRKNLRIGLGLVNSVNLSEFKAIMAHEFGHFSQRSMKFGSHVYNLNKIIYNMLFENDSYEKLLSRWARMHYMFRLMAYINIYLIRGMQAILKKVYLVVNKTYLGLSREMEFHADSIAAYACGSNQAVSALNRIEIGQVCYDELLAYLTAKLNEKKRSENIYEQHAEVIKFYCQKHHFNTDESGLPVIEHHPARAINDKIELDDPWASHPLTEDREKHLTNLHIETKTINYPAWSLFENKGKLQEQLTDLLYKTANVNEEMVTLPLGDFELDFSKGLNSHRYNVLFKDYFDGRNFTEFDIDEVIEAGEAEKTAFEDLFTDTNCRMPALVTEQEQNIHLLEQIIDIRKDVKYFYYRGVKRSRATAGEVKAAIEKEKADTENNIKHLDRRTFLYFYNVTENEESRAELVSKYRGLFACQREAQKDYDLCNDLLTALSPVYGKMQPPQIRATMTEVYNRERGLKPRMKEIVDNNDWKNFISDENLKAVNIYLKNNWQYYLSPNYDNNAINILNKAIQAYINIVNEKGYNVKRDLLDFQAELLAP